MFIAGDIEVTMSPMSPAQSLKTVNLTMSMGKRVTVLESQNLRPRPIR